jgi:nucleoside-diphosphate-sugar epimerase
MPDLSPYARSKFDSERAVKRAAASSPWLALRLPAIYGPGDFATLPYFKLIKSGFALEPLTAAPARASILYVGDAADAMIAATGAPAGAVYEVGDDSAAGREWREIGETLGGVLGRNPRRMRLPRPVISAYHGVLRAGERIAGKKPSVRAGQVNEFFHADWVARDNLLSDVCAWRATTPLKEGFAKTAHWYQEHGLL